MYFPDAMLGMLGGGQLGRMFTLAAHSMGYRVAVLDPDRASPAGAIADVHLRAAYQDREALQQLADTCVAVTTEFENVPADTLRWLAAHCTVRPTADSVAVAQDRIREKRFLTQHGFDVAPYAVIGDVQAFASADAALLPGILKRARFGYDGKGQVRVATFDEARAAFASLGSEPCVLEKQVSLAAEVSVVAARGADGVTLSFPVAENEHRNGILDISIVPARVSAEIARKAEACAQAVATKLGYCGVLAVEFFVTGDGTLLVNEIAPRPHNSGHYTIDACATSQFEQQVRTLCGLPLGDTRLLSPVAMVNLLGDVWQRGQPAWHSVFDCADAKLHLYGKHEARPGRKMGHYTVLGADADDALDKALTIRAKLSPISISSRFESDPAMSDAPLLQSDLKSLPFLHRGKVRDLYAVGDDKLLIVQTDRLSAFDVILPTPIPGKGRVLTELSLFWFEKLRHVVPNHLTAIDPATVVAADERSQIAGRAMVVRKLKPLLVEAVVRGYLIGSGWTDYQASGGVCGIELPAGLVQAQKLPEPIFTPASKAPAGQHDENITYAEVESLVGRDLAARVREVSIRLYAQAAEYAAGRGIIIADTKFEFGVDDKGGLVLIDEALTPDSSRFWPASGYRTGISPPSFDKQFVRDWLETQPWNKRAPAPALPPEVLAQTAAKYAEALRLLKGG